MKINLRNQPPRLLKPLILFVFLYSLSFLAFLSLQPPRQSLSAAPDILPPDLKIRPGYSSYDAYLQRQLNKTLDPKLRQIWTTRDWDRKVAIFSTFFDLKKRTLLSNGSKSLCVEARAGQDIAALKRVGASDSVGMDLVPYPWRFVWEIERTRHGGICVLHVLQSKRTDKYLANPTFYGG